MISKMVNKFGLALFVAFGLLLVTVEATQYSTWISTIQCTGSNSCVSSCIRTCFQTTASYNENTQTLSTTPVNSEASCCGTTFQCESRTFSNIRMVDGASISLPNAFDGVTATGTVSGDENSGSVSLSGGSCSGTLNYEKSGGGGGGGVGCFADGQLVMVSSGEQIPIEHVQVGDRVLTSSGTSFVPTFSKVTWIMTHKTPRDILQFTMLSENGIKAIVEVTPMHYMMVQGKGVVEARGVTVGDQMLILDRMTRTFVEAKVLDISNLAEGKQVRLVLTESGSIVVNDVLASSLESSGSSVVDTLLKFGDFVAGEAGQQIARSVTYSVGSLVTSGDAQAAM